MITPKKEYYAKRDRYLANLENKPNNIKSEFDVELKKEVQKRNQSLSVEENNEAYVSEEDEITKFWNFSMTLIYKKLN